MWWFTVLIPTWLSWLYNLHQVTRILIDQHLISSRILYTCIGTFSAQWSSLTRSLTHSFKPITCTYLTCRYHGAVCNLLGVGLLNTYHQTRPGIEPTTFWSRIQLPNHSATEAQCMFKDACEGPPVSNMNDPFDNAGILKPGIIWHIPVIFKFCREINRYSISLYI